MVTKADIGLVVNGWCDEEGLWVDGYLNRVDLRKKAPYLVGDTWCTKAVKKGYHTEQETEKAENKEAPKVDELQVGGDHYKKLAVQPWTAMEAWMTPSQFRGFLKGNVIKYLARDKNEKEDLQKALHYLTKLLELLD